MSQNFEMHSIFFPMHKIDEYVGYSNTNPNALISYYFMNDKTAKYVTDLQG